MKWRNSPTQYGWLPAGLHWFVLFLLAAVYASMELRDFYPKGSSMREAMKTWHYMLGISTLALTALRLAVYFMGPAPAISPAPAQWQATAAKSMKAALYVFMLGMPILGCLLLSAKGTPIPFFGLHLPALLNESKALARVLKEIHETGATVGYVLIGVHASAALYHHYLLRDDTLRRMLPK
ncbi:cytochrome b [Massilia antarctica]|uniref:Cytochrome b n=1 Tax=Massilia antarctica TaxID=2765360 RepID=A0AA48WA85_9BURK|nr:cytochrome b [Massilia antarctica]QPI47590.1 cytochrome b [Massilia antarctica]